MLKLPFFKKKQGSLDKFLAITINPDDVKCLAFFYDGESFKIIGSGKQELPHGSVRNGILVEKESVEEALKIALNRALNELEEDINSALIGINGNLCLGITTTLKIKKPKGSSFSQKEIKDVYNKISEAAYIQAQNQHLQFSGNPDVDLEIITSSNVYTKTDDGLIEDIENADGGIVELAIFNAFTPSFHLKTLQNLAHKVGLNIKAIGPEMYALNQWIKKINPGSKDFIIMDVANESTNIAVVFGGGIVATKSLDIGYFHIVEGLSQNMGLTFLESEKVLKGYSLGQLTDSEVKIVQDCIRETLNYWLLGIELLFGEFTGVKTFASKIYLTGRGVGLKDLVDFIENEPWTKSIPFKTPPEFQILNMADIDQLSDSTGRVNTAEWINTAIMCIVFEELYEDYK